MRLNDYILILNIAKQYNKKGILMSFYGFESKKGMCEILDILNPE